MFSIQNAVMMSLWYLHIELWLVFFLLCNHLYWALHSWLLHQIWLHVHTHYNSWFLWCTKWNKDKSYKPVVNKLPFYKFKWIQLIFCDCSNVFNDGPLFTLHITAQFRAGNQKVASSSPIRSKPWPITIVALSKALNPRFLQGDCPCNMSALSSSGGNLC